MEMIFNIRLTLEHSNVLPKVVYNQLLDRPKLKKTSVKLSAYNGTEIPVSGKCLAKIKHKNTVTHVLFIVADTKSSPILGLKTSSNLNLIKRIRKIDSHAQDYFDSYGDCFGELGILPGVHHIVTDPNVPPVVNTPRRIPIAMKRELQRMENLDVIEHVTEPSDWVNSLVVVEKPNGQLRICLDPRHLNRAIKRQHLQLPTAEEIIAKMSGAKFFTKLDASSGYWQIKVDQESSKLLTFATPFGRYRFKRLLYGIHSASEIFQASVANIISDIEGASNSQDDIIIWGKTREELHERTVQVLEAIRKNGMKLNPAKCVFARIELIFLGHKVTGSGVKPDPSKISAIIDMPIPSTVKELQRFMGMVNYLGKFLPSLSKVSEPLWKLLEKDAIWSLEKPQLEAIKKLKELVTSSPVLKFFDNNLPTRVSSDAPKRGLGAVLEQEHEDKWSPVAFASRTLTTSEENYCPLEKEALSVVFATQKFHEYLYCRHFDIFNDHKPLKTIFSKSILKAPARIQRFLLRLQRYNFTMNYEKGVNMVVTDTLSRAMLSDSTPEIPEEEISHYVRTVKANLPISDSKFEQFVNETNADPTLQKLKEYVTSGWPNTRDEVVHSVEPYFNYRDEISELNGILLKGHSAVIVPSSMQPEMRKLLHTGHPGIVNMKMKARNVLFWPGMNKELEDFVYSCSACQESRNQKQKEPLISHDIPSTVWTRVGTDLFTLYNNDYLIIADYTSKFFDLHLLPDKTSPTVISYTKSTFAKFGIPKKVMSDNGPEFASSEYK